MAELHHFSYGGVTPVLAYVMSALGCLLGFLIAKKARRHTGARRARLLVYASVAFGAIGIWLGHMIALLGFGITDAIVVYDPVALGTGLIVAVVNIGTGLFVAGFGQRRWWRLLAAGVIIALGTTATQYVTMSAIRVNGTVRYETTGMVVTAAIALSVAAAALWCTTSIPRPRLNALTTALMAGALTAMHYVGQEGIQVFRGEASETPVVGLSPMMLLAPVVLFGATALSLLAFFSVGNVSGHELRVIYKAGADELDPAVVKEVTARIAIGLAANNPPTHPDGLNGHPLHADRFDIGRADTGRADADRANAERRSAEVFANAWLDARHIDARRIDARRPGARPTDARSTDPRRIDARRPDARPTDARRAEDEALTPLHPLPREATAPRPEPRPRPTPGTRPTWQSMPVWGTSEPAADVAVQPRVSNVRPRVGPHSPALPVMPVAALPVAPSASAATGSSTTVYTSAASASPGGPIAVMSDELPSRYPPGFRPPTGGPTDGPSGGLTGGPTTSPGRAAGAEAPSASDTPARAAESDNRSVRSRNQRRR